MQATTCMMGCEHTFVVSYDDIAANLRGRTSWAIDRSTASVGSLLFMASAASGTGMQHNKNTWMGHNKNTWAGGEPILCGKLLSHFPSSSSSPPPPHMFSSSTTLLCMCWLCGCVWVGSGGYKLRGIHTVSPYLTDYTVGIFDHTPPASPTCFGELGVLPQKNGPWLWVGGWCGWV